MTRGTKLWQAAGSPIIQGRSRAERPFWQQAAVAVAFAALLGAVADWAASAPYAFDAGEALTLVRAAGTSAVIGALPALLFVMLGRAAGWSRVSVVAGILSGAVAAGFAVFGWPPA